MTDLTDEDRAAIAELMLYATKGESAEQKDNIRKCAANVALYFMRAGIERAAAVCDKERELYTFDPTPGDELDQMARSACWECAAAIRALLREGKRD